MVEKFKVSVPENEKKNCGNGRVSIQEGDFGGSKLIKVVFRNMIGKTLYEGNISGKMSKIRKVVEKTHKN